MTDSLLTTTSPEGDSGTNDTAETVIGSKVNGQSDPKFFTQEDIEKAREQEKSKLYKRLETMQETVARLEAEARQRAEAEEAAQREIQTQAQREAEEARKRQESEMSAKDLLAQKEQEWQAQMNEVRQQMEAERALRERETQFAQLMEYRQRVVQEYSDRVAPELLDLIDGGTPEEIQQSAESMAARTERILAQTAEIMQNQRQQMPTARVTAPSSGENAGSQRNYTPDEIRNMSMADYAKHRQSLLGGGANGPKNRGIFG
jgi:hypothetical protein